MTLVWWRSGEVASVETCEGGKIIKKVVFIKSLKGRTVRRWRQASSSSVSRPWSSPFLPELSPLSLSDLSQVQVWFTEPDNGLALVLSNSFVVYLTVSWIWQYYCIHYYQVSQSPTSRSKLCKKKWMKSCSKCNECKNGPNMETKSITLRSALQISCKLLKISRTQNSHIWLIFCVANGFKSKLIVVYCRLLLR